MHLPCSLWPQSTGPPHHPQQDQDEIGGQSVQEPAGIKQKRCDRRSGIPELPMGRRSWNNLLGCAAEWIVSVNLFARRGAIGQREVRHARAAIPQSFRPGRGRSHRAGLRRAEFLCHRRGLRDLLGFIWRLTIWRGFGPYFDRLGAPAGGRLNQLARIADKHAPVMNRRDHFGRDEGWIDYHWSYREMEKIAFGDFQFHAISHRAGTLGMDRALPAVAKYALQYLFVQAEFGLMCPISVTDTSIHLIRKFASAELKDYLLPKMLSNDPANQWKGTQFMTERAGGSDVGAIETLRPLRGWRVAALWRQVVLLPRRCRCRVVVGATGRSAQGHPGSRAVCVAAPPEGRPPQRLPHRPPQGQARHPLDGYRARSSWTARSPIWSATPIAASSR